jgi:hypothetical protein
LVALEEATGMKWAEKPNVYEKPPGVPAPKHPIYDSGKDDPEPQFEDPKEKAEYYKQKKLDKMRSGNIDWEFGLTERVVAEAMDQLYFKDILLFTGDGKQPDGFLFNGVFWESIGKHGLQLRQGYCNDIALYYREELEKIRGDPECKSRDRLDQEDKKLLKDLDSFRFTESCMKWIRDAAYQETVDWNSDPDLCVFTDKVYNLKMGEFIEPSRAQFVTNTFGYAFEDGGDDEAVSEARRYIEEEFIPSIVESPEVARYIKIVMSSFLAQGNAEEKGHFWLGCGRNGKGTLSKILAMALGGYYGDLKLGFYTSEDTSPDAPNNNLYNLRNARLLGTSEVGMSTKHPDQAQSFALEKFKMLTGGDAQVARQNHENNQVTFTAGSVLIQTNIMPEMTGVHRAENASLRQRIEIVRFPFSFVSDMVLIAQQPEKYKPVDITIKARFEKPAYRKAFVMMLIDFHKIYREEGIIAPESIKRYKDEYFSQANKVRTWILATVREHDEVDYQDRAGMSITSLYETFTKTGNWVTKGQFIEEATTTLGKRNPTDKTGTRGVFGSSGYYFVQGFELISDNANDGFGF